jgi:hypothetical protein
MATTLTPAQWRDYLGHELALRRPRIDLYERYYDGEHRMAYATSKFREAYGEMFEAFATNWCELVVDIAVDRLKILGFLFGEDQADDDAAAIWQANNLDAGAIKAHTTAIKAETAYLLVSPPSRDSARVHDEPIITVEHPNQVIVAHDPADRRIRLAALKRYTDTNGDLVAIVYTPNSITEFRQKSDIQARAEVLGLTLPYITAGVGDWETVDSQINPINTVPVIPLENCPDLVNGGKSDLKPAVALNDAANKFFSDMIHASEFTSFPQRVMTGVEIPRDPVTGEVAEEAEVKAAVNRLWAFESEAAKVYTLEAGDLSNYVEGVDLAVQHLAAQTRTPPHYLLAKLANISGDALKAAETGLSYRCKRKHIDFSDPWEETMRLCFAWRARAKRRNGDEEGASADEARSKMTDADTWWANPESVNDAQLGDAAIKRRDAGVPWEQLMRDLGYGPKEIASMKKMREIELEQQMEREIKMKRELSKLTEEVVQPRPDVAVS